jgi:hypothetical protein
LDDIVREFAKRFYKESFNDEEYEYDLIWYKWIKKWPVNICDEYYSIGDILIVIKYNIPIKILQKRYYIRLEEKQEINLYNFWLREKDNQKYYEDEFKILKESEKNVEKAKELLFKYLKYE